MQEVQGSSRRRTFFGHPVGLANLFVKDDGQNPSASFKDRAGAVALGGVGLLPAC